MHCLKVTAADIKCIGSCFCVVRGADTDKIRAGDFFIIYDAEMHFLHYNIFKYVWYKISWMGEEWMNYSAETKPGMADPYWYEWSVGQQYIIDMLNPDNNIKCVELQANVKLGLDDVVVTYKDEEKLFIQVKHTRADDTLTFGDLVSIDNSKKDEKSKYSLLRELAKSWIDEKDKYQKTRVCLFTNRKVGRIVSSAGVDKSVRRPALKTFWKRLREQILDVKTFDEIRFPEYESAWDEWKAQLKDIEKNEDKLSFLRCLEIETNQVGLEEIEEDLLKRLQMVFSAKPDVAGILLMKLDHALRTWTTSTRTASYITAEDVYAALAVEDNSVSYNHDLIPAEPFFESRNALVNELEIELKNGSSRVVFLSGIPGTGKTNIVSKISGKRNSIVDIRYYAYEPIDPSKEYLPMDVSKRVDKVNFWDELFNQLRKLLKGKLQKYNVPVVNGLMTLEEMKEQFFNIASRYAADNDSTFIIAIDGIDHAARAGFLEETFLATLPNPEYIPSNVKILLAGQPKENYKNYPLWLFEDLQEVKEIVVPLLQVSDILTLVEDKLPEKSSVYKQQIANLIEKYAQGNTLAAIFAVYEAMQQPDPVELEKRLQNRKLSGNIQEYYKSIWDSAKKNMQIPFVDYKMAGVFAFFNEPINAVKMQEFFPEENISVSGWKNVLKALRPLLIANGENYTILHNDIRVYLSGIIGQDIDHVREIYAGLSDYYLKLKEKSRAYYSDILRFLKQAGREDEFTKVYSADYIISAYVHGVEICELREISKDILKGILAHRSIDWEHMRCLAFGYMTIDQIEKSSYEIEESNFRKSLISINIHPYECYVQPESAWDLDMLDTVISLVKRLYDSGESNRAKSLFKNWFSEIDIVQIYMHMESEDRDREFLTPGLQNIADNLAESVCCSGELSILHGMRELAEINDRFAYRLTESVLKYIFMFLSGKALSSALDTLEVVLIDPLVEGVKKLLEENRYEDIKRVENVLHDRLSRNSMGVLLSKFMQIVADPQEWTGNYKEEIWDQIKDVQLPDSRIENLMTYYSIYAVVAAYLQQEPRTIVASAITDRYMEKHKHSNRTFFGMYFNNICFIGKWLYARHAGVKFLENASEMKLLMNALFVKHWNPNDRDFETFRLRPFILKAYIMLSINESAVLKNTVDDICEIVFSTNPVNQLLDAGIFYYRNDKKRMKDWFDEWLAEDGKVWNESIGERNRIIQDFCTVKEKYDTDNIIDMSSALEKARWSVIGYASHKEYTGDYLLNWYNTLVEYDDVFIYEYAETVKEISDKIELVGDNRLEYILNSKIFADIFSGGYLKIEKILQNNHYLAQAFLHPSYFADGLIGYLKNVKLKESELLSIWAIGMGLLDWRNEDNHATIHSLQRAIELCAEKSGIKCIYNKLREYGAAYIDLVSDPVKYIIPDRWCDSEGSVATCSASIETVKKYISNGESTVKASELKEVVQKLIDRNEMPEEVFIELLTYEFGKDSYSINHNSFLEYLVGQSKKDVSDHAIYDYLNAVLQRESYYLESDLPELVRWKMRQQGELYCKEGMDEIIKMQRSWMTAAGHFQEPEIEDNYNYYQMIDWDEANSIETLFYQIMKVLILSEDADAARIALTGLFAMVRCDNKYIENIETDWDNYHYRAKEWLMMLYELLWYFDKDSRPVLYEIIQKHCKDDDFNVALYSNIILETLWPEQFQKYLMENKSFFSAIPTYGIKKLIKTTRHNPWINGYECVMEMKERIEDCLEINLDDVERRTADYADRLLEIPELIKLNRSSSSCRVVCDKVNIAFFRVLYKDWLSGRWDGAENELARIVLSASEPYTLFVTPSSWRENKGIFISNFDKFSELSREKQLSEIEKILNNGVSGEDIVLAGAVVDYTHKQEIFGFWLTYLDISGMKPEYAACAYEKNSRLLLQKRDDFWEKPHFNITMHHNGIESFKQSNILCGFSKEALLAFGWYISIDSGGVKLLNECGVQIGQLECYYGNRTSLGNRYHSNQPHMQRWIVRKEIFDKAIQRIPVGIKYVTDISISDFE